MNANTGVVAGPLLQGAVFITGGASGIGRASAYAFVHHGVRQVALADINADLASATATELQRHFEETQGIKVDVLALSLDVNTEASVAAAITEIVHRFGRIDYAINSAGVRGPREPTADHSLEDWRRVLDINLNGVWMSQRAEIQQMLKQEPLVPNSPRHNRGVIVNLASMYGVISPAPGLNNVAYVSSKHGVVGMTKADALTYASHGIRINAICPGYVDTPLLAPRRHSEAMQAEIEKVPMKRFALPEEIADHIVFLASPMSSFMCGAAMVADGGFSIH